MNAFGQVRHRFHGDYSFVIAIVFASTEDATRVLPLFPVFELAAPGINTLDRAIVRLAQGRKINDPHNKRTEVDDVKALIEKWRVYPPKSHCGPIDGTPFSIDSGPMFHLDLTRALVEYHDAQSQLPLF